MTTDLTSRLAEKTASGLDLDLFVPLLRLLAHGDPVPVGRLATEVGLSEDGVRVRLAAVPDTEYDAGGNIVGQGLTMRPTPHRFTVDGEELYTWCAFDTLLFPALLDETARVESVSASSGEPIRLTVSPTGVSDLEPASAMVSLVIPDDGSIRSSFCNQVHFFSSPEDAAAWLAGHPEATALPVADAHQLGLDLIDTNGLTLGAFCAPGEGHACAPTPTSADGCCG